MSMNDSTPEIVDPAIRTRNRQKLIILFSIGIGPMLLAYFMFFYFPSLVPGSTTNEGMLVSPALPVQELPDNTLVPVGEGHWTLLIPAGEACGDTCQQLLYVSRQIRVGLGKDVDRLSRVLLVREQDQAAVTGAYDGAEHEDLVVQAYNLDMLEQSIAERLETPAQLVDVILLMDPNGNIMMLYTADKVGAPMRKDLKHLLKISNIG